MRSSFLAFAFVCAAGGCSPGSTQVVGTGATPRRMMGPGGGGITLEGAPLAVPPGALAAPTAITITSTKGSIAAYRQFSPIYRFEPDGLQFAQPATLTITPPDDPGSAFL